MFTFSGIASGLDTSSIIKQLVAVESIPIQQLESKKAGEKAKLDLVATLKKHVKALQDAAGELRTMEKLRSFTAKVSKDGIADVQVTGKASPGTHTLQVHSLAQIDRWAFDAVTDELAALAGGAGETVSFSVGGEQHVVEIDPEQSNIHQIASTINAQAGAAVQASVVNTGTAGAPSYQLVLTSKASGKDHRIAEIESTVAGLAIDGTGPDSQGVAQSANHLTVGSNAVVTVDGLTVERSTNKIDGVLVGVTVDLVSANQGEELAFTVSADNAAIKARVQKLVDAHNQVVQFINGQNKFDENAGPGGKLFGDSLLSTVRRELRTALFDVDLTSVTEDQAGYATLGLVGIELDNEGQLSIDSAVFDDKLAENLDLFAALFVDSKTSTPGAAERLFQAIKGMFDKVSGEDGAVFKGLFDARTDAIQATIKRYDAQIEQREVYLEKFEENLKKRFTALEQLMGALNAQGAALTNALASLNFNKKE